MELYSRLLVKQSEEKSEVARMSLQPVAGAIKLLNLMHFTFFMFLANKIFVVRWVFMQKLNLVDLNKH